MAVGRRWPTLEILAMDLKEAYRFPIPEILAFLYAFFPLIFSPVAYAAMGLEAEEARLLIIMSLSSSMISFITIILILKNISYGLANEIRKGLVQTYLTYPVGRASFFLVKLISGVLIPIAYIVLSICVFTGLLFPDLALKHLDVFLLGLLAFVADVLLPASLMFLAAIAVRRGGASLAIGIALLFAVNVISSILLMIGNITGWEGVRHVYYTLNPLAALMRHYSLAIGGTPLGPGGGAPTMWECVAYLSGNYAIAIAFYVAALIYFLRRFEPV
ncbi:hypothetical protein B6U66_00230 [Candidatus Bathyarchaeota archaeon ex4484_135]|nr:MAG: hypothetical protein B6U66_00230 [Candidatus Bathyarchaeota archaeon ex4484_135]